MNEQSTFTINTDIREISSCIISYERKWMKGTNTLDNLNKHILDSPQVFFYMEILTSVTSEIHSLTGQIVVNFTLILLYIFPFL